MTFRAVQYQHTDVSSAAVLHKISGHLKMAPHRHGGVGKGCRVLPVDAGLDHSSTTRHSENECSDVSLLSDVE